MSVPAIRRAFLAVPRERFLSDVAAREGLPRVYQDQAIVTVFDERGAPASSSSQPSLMASMLERLELRPGHRVLEIGAGTGYNAALLARIVGARGEVISVELDPATARRARSALATVKSAASVVVGDGRDGWARGAPYDRIVVTASSPTVQFAWHDQLADGGLLELPLVLHRGDQAQVIVTLRKDADVLRSTAVLGGGFMALRDAPGAPVPSPPPSVAAHERVDGDFRSLAQLSGAALRGLSRTRRRQLLALALSEPRRRALGLRAPLPDLMLYLTIQAPRDRLVGGWPAIGVISADGDGLALLAGGPKAFTRIEAFGDGDAERLLIELIETWKHCGRPAADDLQVTVDFDRTQRSAVRMIWDC
ncbi:MAG: Protein-L-isoaspartate O-methyltransferase [uncultured Solirubrobacteraceae bacterium]|uniref:Protein-L-isoaspartate O-methyltransferase n=1 Tax=uncultured Solirubrobacteraceae bacterium TaxID=1162706 RepID=A0A6J4TKG5_9ACTN|nr:MAG: Protein-L-isoaspartate O-methyltransferase [uncultured Solirubrobacteraceae bacterium]